MPTPLASATSFRAPHTPYSVASCMAWIPSLGPSLASASASGTTVMRQNMSWALLAASDPSSASSASGNIAASMHAASLRQYDRVAGPRHRGTDPAVPFGDADHRGAAYHGIRCARVSPRVAGDDGYPEPPAFVAHAPP